MDGTGLHDDDTTPAGEDGAGGGARQVPFALFGHPLVQLVRFGAKVGLVYFLTIEELGVALFAGLFVFLGQYAALLGMDDVVVHAPRLGTRLWRRLSRFTHATGIVLGLGVLGLGWLLGGWLDEPELPRLTAALAPTVWLGNWGTLPTALLLRERAFRAVFAIDVAGVAGYAVCTLGSAALGAGPWSLVFGWYANAVLTLVVARSLARAPLARLTDAETSAEEEGRAFRYGLEVSGASFLSFAGLRADGYAVSIVLGSALFGLYEWSLFLATFGLGYATSLAERCLFPILSEEGRRAGSRSADSGRARRTAFRLTAFLLVPLHVLLALVAEPLVTTFFPREVHAAAPLVALFALAAGARCLEIFADTSLKAAGRGAVVLRLSAVRLVLLAATLAFTLPSGELVRVAQGVLVARVLAALISLVVELRITPASAFDGARTAGLPVHTRSADSSSGELL